MHIGPIFFPWERIPAYVAGPALFAFSVYLKGATRPLTMNGYGRVLSITAKLAPRWRRVHRSP